MNSRGRIVPFLPLFAAFILFPFFEGNESPTGLFLLHSIVFFSLAVCALFYSELRIPRFLLYFLPFLVVLMLSTGLAAYKYSAFLKLLDYCMAGVWGILACTLVSRNRERSDGIYSWLFLAGAGSTILAILLFNTARIMRISASFVNPNDYAAFALMLLCFGVFCLELEVHRTRKLLIGTFLVVLILSIALSFSRGAFVTSILIAAIVVFRRKPGKLVTLLFVLMLLISGVMIAMRFGLYRDPLQYHRWKIWMNSLEGVADDPYFGVGLGMLEYRALSFNFPADSDLGRYSRIARSADSQYVQILAETGFLGLFTFLIGWIALFFALKKSPQRYFYLRQAWIVIIVSGMVSIPLQNTSIHFLIFLLSVLALTDVDSEVLTIRFGRIGRIATAVSSSFLLIVAVYLPYRADREFKLAVKAPNFSAAQVHLMKAVRYNPLQPYYRFAIIRRTVDVRPDWETERWLNLVSACDEVIALNPVEYEFYVYKARILRILLEREPTLNHYAAAISSYQTALDYNRYNVFLRAEFASFLNRLGKHNLAEKEVRTALEYEPLYLNARLLLIDILVRMNKKEEAQQEMALFRKHQSNFRTIALNPPTGYIRSLLQVNHELENKVMNLL